MCLLKLRNNEASPSAASELVSWSCDWTDTMRSRGRMSTCSWTSLSQQACRTLLGSSKTDLSLFWWRGTRNKSVSDHYFQLISFGDDLRISEDWRLFFGCESEDYWTYAFLLVDLNPWQHFQCVYDFEVELMSTLILIPERFLEEQGSYWGCKHLKILSELW